MRRLIMNWDRRMLSCGGITGGRCGHRGGICPLSGGSSGLGCRSLGRCGHGGLVIWLASERLLPDAMACLAALGDEEADHRRTHARRGADRPIPVLGQQTSTPGSLICTTSSTI